VKIRLIMLSISCLVIGLAYATNRPVADKHVFAPTEPAGAVQAASTASPSPTSVPVAQSSDSDGAGTIAATTPVPTQPPLPAATPAASPDPTPTPVPTLEPKPLPTILPHCGGCGSWPPGHHPEIMCPMYCVD
jgi:hypothetical protein